MTEDQMFASRRCRQFLTFAEDIRETLATAQMLHREEQKEARATVFRLIEALNGRQKDRLT